MGVLSYLEMMDCVMHEHKEEYIGHHLKENESAPIQPLGWVKICHPVLPDQNPLMGGQVFLVIGD